MKYLKDLTDEEKLQIYDEIGKIISVERFKEILFNILKNLKGEKI